MTGASPAAFGWMRDASIPDPPGHSHRATCCPRPRRRQTAVAARRLSGMPAYDAASRAPKSAAPPASPLLWNLAGVAYRAAEGEVLDEIAHLRYGHGRGPSRSARSQTAPGAGVALSDRAASRGDRAPARTPGCRPGTVHEARRPARVQYRIGCTGFPGGGAYAFADALDEHLGRRR